MNISICATKKGKPRLVVDEFIYNIDKQNAKSYNWSCSLRKSHQCKCKIITELINGEHKILSVINEHSHEPNKHDGSSSHNDNGFLDLENKYALAEATANLQKKLAEIRESDAENETKISNEDQKVDNNDHDLSTTQIASRSSSVLSDQVSQRSSSTVLKKVNKGIQTIDVLPKRILHKPQSNAVDHILHSDDSGDSSQNFKYFPIALNREISQKSSHEDDDLSLSLENMYNAKELKKTQTDEDFEILSLINNQLKYLQELRENSKPEYRF